MDHLLAEQGLAPESHPRLVPAARTATWPWPPRWPPAWATPALGIEAAARSFGLDFVPLVDEDYFLVCLATRWTARGAGPAPRAADSRPGPTRWPRCRATAPAAGEVLSLTRALPWWQFRTPKAAAADAGATQANA
jgi:putative molybdopterin biosynthesis protein